MLIKKTNTTVTFTGEYAGFDENEPTSRSGGKGLVVRRLKEQNGYERLVIIGDGATDAEASPPADGFIGKLSCYIYEI